MQITRDIEKYANDYAKGDFDFENILVKYRRKRVLEILDQYQPQNILEIGCGMQPMFDFYSEFDRFTTMEPAKEFYLNAVQRANDNQNIEVINDYLHNKVDYLKNKHFDFIICSCLLHEVENPNELINDICAICSKDTIVNISVPNSRSFHLLWAYESGLIDKLDELTSTANKLQQNTTFDIEKLCNIAKDFNLEILDKGSYFIKPFNHKKMSQLVNEQVIDDKLLNGLYNLTEFMPDFGTEIYVNCRLNNDND